MNSLFTFLASPAGRITRIAAGVALFATGALLGGGWWTLAIVGLVPLAAGLFDVCVFAPLFHRPFKGRQLRESVAG